jgi:ABC-2 type transport system ATP-binding protein
LTRIVEFDSVVKDYGSRVIGPLSISVDRGDVMGLVGPNGSGKTTTIRLTLGLIRPTGGRVLVNGHQPHMERVEALRGVGYSPELPNLPTFFTPRELLRLICGELGLDANIKDASDEVLEKVGLIAYADTKISKLSKGMVQRLSIAQALLGQPRLLVLDEPLIGVDPLGSDHLRKMLREFASAGGTVILSSHQLSEVEGLCNRVTAFRHGKVLFSGPVSELVAKFLGETTIVVEAAGLSAALLEGIKGIRGVLRVEPTPTGARIRVTADGDLRPTIARMIVGAGCDLRELRYLNNALEELYRRTVGGGAVNEA